VLQRHRLHHGDGTRPRVTRGATVGMPTAHGLLRATGYRDELGGVEHLALAGGPTTGVPLVGVHVECLLGEVFGSLACSCAHRLDASLQRVAAEGGVVVYVRGSRGSHVRNATTTAAAHTGSRPTPPRPPPCWRIWPDRGAAGARCRHGGRPGPSGITVASMTTPNAAAFSPAAGY
jgi:hypothetical protein